MEQGEGSIEKWKTDMRDAFASGSLDLLDSLLNDRRPSNKTDNEFEKLLQEQTWIFTSLCQLGAGKIIERLLRIFTLDVNVTEDGLSAIQLACRGGHGILVELLLNNGAKLKETVWDEDSEFYLATLQGHSDVLNALLQMQSELIFDINVAYCLFYAACKGGHMSMVHRWITPGIDVNCCIPFISSLDGCEFKYPLMAACQGGHIEIAMFLINDLHATITKDISEMFPQATCQLVRNSFMTSAHSQEQNFLMSDIGINHVASTWFEIPERTSDDDGQEARPNSFSDIYETKIDLSRNNLFVLPSELIWELPFLVELNASMNNLTDIPCPRHSVSPDTNSLTSLSLSKCHLKRLSVYIFHLPNLRMLDVSHNQIESLPEDDGSSSPWKCRQLMSLNLSHNALTSLPSSLQECTSLENLNVSHNDLSMLCSPWQCPMKTLDVSHNQIGAFPPSCDQFWAGTLRTLNASHNVLTQLYESMVKMNLLKHLDVSFNVITSMPRGMNWSCPLIYLDLSHNKLGVKHSPSHKLKSAPSIQSTYTPDIELPAACLAPTLLELYLNHNELYCLPDGLCYLNNLTVLNIKCNPNLSHLPLEMGMLWSLLVLRTDGIKLVDKDMQAMVNALNDQSNVSFQTFDFINAMEQRLRECMYHDVIKMVVFGCKNSGGHCILQKMMKLNKGPEYKHEHKTLCVSRWRLPHSKKFQTAFKRDLTFQTWEFPVSDAMSVTHPCFLTENSIYLVVHYAYYDEHCLDSMSKQIAAIKASVSQPCIIVVGVFLSFKEESYPPIRDHLINNITKVMKCYFAPLALDDKGSVDSLLAYVYQKASSLPNVQHGRKLLVDRKVPKLFVNIADKVKDIERQCCSRDELLTVLGMVPKDLQDTVDRRLTLQEFLLQVGAMLHYNVLMGDLWNLVILDPVWLYDLLQAFMKMLGRGKPRVEMLVVREFVEGRVGGEPILLPTFISLLEFFNIAMRIEEGVGIESLLIPSLLPDQSPAYLSSDISYGLTASRFYCLPAIPSALWSHIITQLIPAFDRFTNPSPSLPEFVKQKVLLDGSKKSFKRGTRNSMSAKGLCVRNKGIQFWSTGIMVWHDHGLVVVEEVLYQPDSDSNLKGILVTVKTREDDTHLPSHELGHAHICGSSPKQLAAIGVVTDELEEILELFNPSLLGFMTDYQPIALCPHCHQDIKPGQGVIKDEVDHFQINICAQRILWEDHVFCGKNAVCLEHIMPEFLFLELPDEFRIRFEDLTLFDVKLGQGMVGSVIKGRYKQTDVALKSFYIPDRRPVFEREVDPMYPNTGISNFLSQPMTRQDHNDTERKKVLDAFLDLRREVSILSKLKHKCIIAFLGVCVKQQLLLVLELAPLGSFRSCLVKMKEENNIPVYRQSVSDPTVITKSVFGKDLTFKILLQISSGLSYLHDQSIIFRDLKPDNILVMSLSLDDDINVKVTDYGISRFSTARGLSGLAGTVCYMAPEVLAKQTYTNKVDVYSLGIVMFESLTGVSPLDLQGTKQQPLVSEIAKSSSTPLHVKFFKVSCNFPCLEGLMSDCWSYHMDDRPSITEVIGRMTSHQFLILHDVLWEDQFTHPLVVTCIYSCQTSGRTSLWISESSPGDSIRLFSVYDVTSSLYTVRRKEVPGSKVIAMVKVREKIWMISEGCLQVEEIVRSPHNKFEVRKGTCLDQEPSSLVCHSWRSDNTGEDHVIVLIGHTNGTITTYHVNTQRHKVVTTTTMLLLQTDFPITTISSLSNHHIMATADHDLFLLHIQEQTRSSGDATHQLSVCVEYSFSLYTSLGFLEHVDHLVADTEDSVWLSFDGKNKLVKFNWKEKSVEENLLLFGNSSLKKVDVISNNSSNNLKPSTNPRPTDAPPPRPLRKSVLREDLGITSLCLTSNLLVVGTDTGELFLLPISGNSIQEDCPLQLPLLEHPQKQREDGQENGTFRSHSDSVVSNQSANRNSNLFTFSMSKIISAGKKTNKIVSLIQPDSDENALRKHQTLLRREARRKRAGGIFPQLLESGSTLPAASGACPTLNGNTRRRGLSNENQHGMTNRAEIAIWDDVTGSRLNAIKSYTKGFC